MSRLGLHLLGPPHIERDGQPVRMDTRKAIALLAYIAITGESQRRDALVNLLWPEYDATHGRANLRRTLYALRKALADDWLEVDRENVRLNPRADIWLDVDLFHTHLAECLTHGHPASEVCPACLSPLADAVALYRGDFLSGFSLKDSFNFDDWQFFQADALQCELARALDRLVQGHSAQGAFEPALNYARQWLALDRLNEAAHYQLMQLYAWSDQRSAALRQYQECVKVLGSELGVEPAAETRRLYERIRDGEFGRGAEGQRGKGESVVVPPPAFLHSAPPHPGPPAAFVAREPELARLCGHLDVALTGRGRVVFVIGGPGRGKTALIQEFARRAQDRSVDLIFAGGSCNAHTGYGDPYLPFREILGLLTGDVDALWGAGAITREHARRLWDSFPLAVEALVEVGPDLIDTFIPGRALVRRAAAYAAGGIGGQAAWQTQLEELVARKAALPHDPNLQQSALFEQYARTMAALARERPLLLALDDLQWADVGSVGLLFHLGRSVARGRVLIVGGYRPEEVAAGHPPAPAVGHVSTSAGERERHRLVPVVHEFQRTFGAITIDLAQAEGRRFVEEYLDTEPNRLSAGFRETLYRQTRGHALFTVELLHGMQDRGDLIQDGEGRWMEGPALDWETLPARVEAVIAERIDRLDAPSRETLRVASVEGETFTAEVVARVRSADKRETVERLSGQLERRHRLVRAQEIQRLGARRLSRYRFRHILFQNYLYHSLDPVERAHLHEAVGRALEALCGEETEHMAVTLARHFQEAEIADKAIDYLLQAGEKAKRSSANEAAIAHLVQALELLKTTPETPERDQRELDLQLALGVPLVLTKGHGAPEVEAAYVRARELCEHAYAGDTSQRFQVLLGLRRYHIVRGELRTARELGEELLALAQREKDPSYLSRAHMMHTEISDTLGEFAQARDHCKQAMASYDPRQCWSHIFLYGNDTGIGCQIYEALATWHLGYPDQALKKAEETLALAQQLSHPFTLVFALYYSARLHKLCREVGAVQEHVEALLHIATERAFTLFQAFGNILRGWVLAERGEIGEGITEMQQELAAWRAMGYELLLPTFYSFLAEAYGKAGQAEEGLRVVANALAIVEKTGERKFEAELYRLKGELLVWQAEAKAKPEAKAEAEVKIEVERCYHEAEACFLRALEVARRQRAKSWELRAATSLSRLWQSQGKREEARRSLQETYGWFTEGFGTADLVEAKALLDELA